MKQLIDFIPLFVFFFLYKTHDIYVATGALIAATAIQIALTWLRYKKVEKVQLLTFAMVAVFGGLTLFLRDDDFIKWKVTIIYIVFATGLGISQYLGKPLIKGMLSKELHLPEQIWKRINIAWILFFISCAIANVYIAFQLPLDVWVNFKVFGLLALTLIFTLATGGYIYHHMPKETDSE